MIEWLEGPAILAEWYQMHTVDAAIGHESTLLFETLEDGQWVSGQLVRDGLEAILAVCNKAVGSETGIVRALGGGRDTRPKPRLSLGAVNPQAPLNDKGKVVDGTGLHWVLVATMEDDDTRKEFAVEIDPANPSPSENAGASEPSQKMAGNVLLGIGDEDWRLGWKKGMAAILGQELPGAVPALQHLESNDCGVWVLMMIWFIMAIMRGRVDPDAAVQAVHDLHGSVAHFRKFLREGLLAAKADADAYATAHPEKRRMRSADQGPEIVAME